MVIPFVPFYLITDNNALTLFMPPVYLKPWLNIYDYYPSQRHLNRKQVRKRTWTVAIFFSATTGETLGEIHVAEAEAAGGRNLLWAQRRGKPEERFDPNDRSGNNFHTCDVTCARLPSWLHRAAHLPRNSHLRRTDASGGSSRAVFFRVPLCGHRDVIGLRCLHSDVQSDSEGRVEKR